MSAVHRKGNLYREWHSFSSRYCTWPMSRAEMAALLFSREFCAGFTPTAREVARAKDAIEERLERVDAGGTSARNSDGSFCTRCTDAWDEEQCAYCEEWHHAYDPKPGGCGSCGEGARARGHKRPCAHHAGEQPCRKVKALGLRAVWSTSTRVARCGVLPTLAAWPCEAAVALGACADAGLACEARELP